MTTRLTNRYGHPVGAAATSARMHREGSDPLHAVFATDHEHNVYRVSDPLAWGAAQSTWQKMDEARRSGVTPQWKHFEVRAVTLGPNRPLVGPEVRSHGKYDRAPFCLGVQTVVKGRGFGNVEDAARVAWKRFAPRYWTRWDRDSGRDEPSGEQGLGGWFYYPNGQTVAQGLRSLADVCVRKQMVVQGGNGRWYVVDQERS